jgi:hypothetical protein
MLKHHPFGGVLPQYPKTSRIETRNSLAKVKFKKMSMNVYCIPISP